MSFKTQNLLLVYNAFGCLILDREWIFWTKNTHCISLLRELFPSSRAPLAWVSGSNETLYHQLGIFMLIPLWPLLVSYIRKQNTKFIGAVQGFSGTMKPKICQGSCLLSTRKKHGFHMGRKNSKMQGWITASGGNSHSFRRHIYNSQLTASRVGNDPNNWFKASFFRH